MTTPTASQPDSQLPSLVSLTQLAPASASPVVPRHRPSTAGTSSPGTRGQHHQPGSQLLIGDSGRVVD
jgi:hypothetical protein